MRLYKFREGNYNNDGSNQDLNNISENYLWFSFLKDLNDPLEGAYKFTSSNLTEEIALKFVELHLHNQLVDNKEIEAQLERLKKETIQRGEDIARIRAIEFLNLWIHEYKEQQAIFSGTLELTNHCDTKNSSIQNK